MDCSGPDWEMGRSPVPGDRDHAGRPSGGGDSEPWNKARRTESLSSESGRTGGKLPKACFFTLTLMSWTFLN